MSYNTNMKTISVFGGSTPQPGSAAYQEAQLLGSLLAGSGYAVQTGGYIGTMEAVSRGASEAGGKTIGVTCSALTSSRVNEYINREIVTSSLAERLDTLITLGNGYVVLPGGTGTLLELAKIWELKNKGFLKKSKLIILVGGFWKPLLDLIAREDKQSIRHVKLASGPENIKDFLFSDI